MLNRIRQQPHFVFFVDGTGALVSAGGLLLLAWMEKFFGLPTPILLELLPIPLALACCSWACYLLRVSRWRLFLRCIALANLLYCIVTLLVLYQYADHLSVWAWLYFAVEIPLGGGPVCY